MAGARMGAGRVIAAVGQPRTTHSSFAMVELLNWQARSSLYSLQIVDKISSCPSVDKRRRVRRGTKSGQISDASSWIIANSRVQCSSGCDRGVWAVPGRS